MNAKQRRRVYRKFKYGIRLPLQSFNDRRLIMTWLKTNKISDWRSPETNLWKFATEQDAVLFKLKWA